MLHRYNVSCFGCEPFQTRTVSPTRAALTFAVSLGLKLVGGDPVKCRVSSADGDVAFIVSCICTDKIVRYSVEIDWSEVDWSKTNVVLSRELGVSRQRIQQVRKHVQPTR